jgi:hypothetical protein
MEKTIKTLRAPSQRILYYGDPIKVILTDKKIKLQLIEQCFIFSLSKTQPFILYIVYKNKIIRLNKLLHPYTREQIIKQQFLTLLQKPTIIQSIEITIIVLECIFIFSDIFNIDLTSYIKHNSLDKLIKYYFKLSETPQLKTIII